MSNKDYKKQFAAEFIGMFFLLAIIVGSGIMAERLSGGSEGLALLANSIATGAGLIVLIMMFSQISGAHFNPLVTLLEFHNKKISSRTLYLYCVAQLSGAFFGVLCTHIMFSESWLSFSSKPRKGPAIWLSEFLATFGLIAVIKLVGQSRRKDVAVAVGLYIAAAYWFTSSTSFANPAVTIARSLTPTFTGIEPTGIMGFILAQFAGAVVAEKSLNYLFTEKEKS